jgi:drug/metabolite transporter (DMT)-like permease
MRIMRELHRPTGRSRLGFFFASTTMLLWGVLPLALEITLVSMDAYTITWYRFLASALLLGSVLAQRRRLPRLGTLTARIWRLLGIATTFLAANYVFYLLGLQHTNPANSQVLIQLAPVLLALGGLWVFRERFTRLQWTGFAVLLLGLATFVRDQLHAFGARADEYYLGGFLMLVAAVAWAVYGLAQKQLLHWLPSQAIMLCIYAGCALLLSPLSTPGRILHMDPLGLGMLVFCALNTLVAYGTFSEALAHWEASRVGAVLALTPVMTIASSAAADALWPGLMARAVVSPAGLFGAGLVVLGSLLTALGQGPAGAARPAVPAGRSPRP